MVTTPSIEAGETEIAARVFVLGAVERVSVKRLLAGLTTQLDDGVGLASKGIWKGISSYLGRGC